MSKLFACIISPDLKQDKDSLQAVAHQFSYAIEMLDDGIVFDVSGLERLIRIIQGRLKDKKFS